MYIITARRMTSGELLKYRKGLFITAGYESLFPGSSRSRFTLTVPNYPHAPWWKAPPEPPPSINPTGSIVAVLTKRNVAHPWVERGTEFCWRFLEDQQPAGFDDLRCAIAFLKQASDRDRASVGLSRIRDYLFSSDEIEFDLSTPGYVHPPLDWAPAPIEFGRGLFTRDQLMEGLTALADGQRDDGGWPIKWPAISPGVELEWRGRVTIDALRTLQAYASWL